MCLRRDTVSRWNFKAFIFHDVEHKIDWIFPLYQCFLTGVILPPKEYIAVSRDLGFSSLGVKKRQVLLASLIEVKDTAIHSIISHPAPQIIIYLKLLNKRYDQNPYSRTEIWYLFSNFKFHCLASSFLITICQFRFLREYLQLKINNNHYLLECLETEIHILLCQYKAMLKRIYKKFRNSHTSETIHIFNTRIPK